MSECNIVTYFNNSCTFFTPSCYVYFFFNIDCLLPFFTLIALSDVDVRLLCYDYVSSVIHTCDGVTVKSLSSSLIQKISVATDRLCQITLNQTLSCNFKKWQKFSRPFKVNHAKRK